MALLHITVEKVVIEVKDSAQIEAVMKELTLIHKKLNHLTMTQQEAIDKLNGVASQLTKVKSEVQNLVDAAANDGNVSAELQAAIDAVASATQGVDDLNADEATTPPEDETPAGEQPA